MAHETRQLVSLVLFQAGLAHGSTVGDGYDCPPSSAILPWFFRNLSAVSRESKGVPIPMGRSCWSERALQSRQTTTQRPSAIARTFGLCVRTGGLCERCKTGTP
jgi:hypothetical protein